MIFQAIGLGLSVAQMVGGASARAKGNRQLAGSLNRSLSDLRKRKGEIGVAAEAQRELAQGDFQENQKAEGQQLGRTKTQVISQMEESNNEFATDTQKEGQLASAVENMDVNWEESKRRNTMQLDKVMASIDQFEEEERLKLEQDEQRMQGELDAARSKTGFFSNLFG